jgi:hypothetical protein
MLRKRIRVRRTVPRERWVVEILPLDPRDQLVLRAKQAGRRRKAS